MTDCDKHNDWKLLSTGSSLHVYVKEVVSRDVIDGKREQNRTRDQFARTFPWRSRCSKRICEADSDFTHASLNQRRQYRLSSRSSPPGNFG